MIHKTVLLSEAIQGLAIKPEGIYVDATFGRGGHSRTILERLSAKGRLYALDKDRQAIHAAESLHDSRFQICHDTFSQLKVLAKEWQILGKVDGILLDLGVSSPQLDDPKRGFSFVNSGPLDMRMDTKQSLTAMEFINKASVDKMQSVFRLYGEERFAGRIAKAIEKARLQKEITTTDQLAEIVKNAHPRWEKHKHPATRVFQSVRIYVNQELEELKQVLADSKEILSSQGRLVVISFHSLEDRLVKNFLKNPSQTPDLPREIPIKTVTIKEFKKIGKAIRPTIDEIAHNRRSRSAVLRIGEKI